MREPPRKVDTGAYKFKTETLDNISNRVNHWPGWGGDSEEEDFEKSAEVSGKPPYSFSLAKLNKLVVEKGLDPKEVFIGARFDEDYLSMFVQSVKKQTIKEQELEYQELLSKWNEQEESRKKYELERAEQEMKRLQEKLATLKK
jgi:hypothetical protein